VYSITRRSYKNIGGAALKNSCPLFFAIQKELVEQIGPIVRFRSRLARIWYVCELAQKVLGVDCSEWLQGFEFFGERCVGRCATRRFGK